MHKKILILSLAFLLSACGGTTQNTANATQNQPDAITAAPSATSTTEQIADSDPETIVEASATPAPTEAVVEATEAPDLSNLPLWYGHTFTDAATGQEFSINDYHGKVVLVEMMAMWCSNCLRQQGAVLELHEMLGERDDLVTIVIDVDHNETLDRLAGYVQQNGFPWLYGVAPATVLREISQLYGDEYLTPPFTPMMIIDQDGNSHLLSFSHKTAADLLSSLEPFLDN